MAQPRTKGGSVFIREKLGGATERHAAVTIYRDGSGQIALYQNGKLRSEIGVEREEWVEIGKLIESVIGAAA